MSMSVTQEAKRLMNILHFTNILHIHLLIYINIYLISQLITSKCIIIIESAILFAKKVMFFELYFAILLCCQFSQPPVPENLQIYLKPLCRIAACVNAGSGLKGSFMLGSNIQTSTCAVIFNILKICPSCE